jgi:RimJ/RimL family protein N-acetyltransferase
LDHLAVAVLEIFRSEALVADVVGDGAAGALGEEQDESRIRAGQLQLLVFLPVIGLEAYAADHENGLWTYLPHGPYHRLENYLERMRTACVGDDPIDHAIIEIRSGKSLGQASYMSIDPRVGCIEVGAIIYAPALQRTTAATESMYLMMRRVFDELGYRRYAWQCSALNGPSRAAAARLGFTLEGIFRQASVSKGCNRDTAWFSILDHEWSAQKDGFEQWLDPGNFDTSGRQRRRSLSSLVGRALPSEHRV